MTAEVATEVATAEARAVEARAVAMAAVRGAAWVGTAAVEVEKAAEATVAALKVMGS